MLGIASGVVDDDVAGLPEVDRIWVGRTGIAEVQGDRLNFLGVIAGTARGGDHGGAGPGRGGPPGVVVGRVSWSLTAEAAYAAGDLRVPVLAAVAVVPAWRLTRVTIAEGLRAE